MEFIKRLRRYKIFQHSQTEPVEFHDSIIEASNWVASLPGLDIFSEGFSIFRWNTVFGFLSVIVFVLTSVYTALDVRGNAKDLMFCLVTFGMAPHESVKFYTFLGFRDKFIWLHQYTRTLYREECNARTKSIMMDNLFILHVIVKTIFISYSVAYVVMVSLPLVFSMATGEKILPFGFRMPYFDQTTWFGYNSNYALHFVLSLYVLSEGMGPDSMFMVLMMSSFTQIDLLKTSLQELSEKINKKELNIGNSLKHIINRHQEHLR